PKFQRTEARTRCRVLLKEVLDLLIDRNPACPAGRRVRASLNVAWEEFDTGEQAANPTHMVIAVSTNTIANAVKYESLILERLQRLEALLQDKSLAFLIRPECIRHDAVRAEHDYEPLLASRP